MRSILETVRRYFSGRGSPEALPSEAFRVAIERLVGRAVGEVGLYEEALRHRSILREHPELELASNERLEFLGDAVLGLIISHHLFDLFPTRDEGLLTRMRARLVNGPVLARYAKKLDLGLLVIMSENTAQSGGRSNETILADAFEAIVGALYLDLGYEAARSFVLQAVESTLEIARLVDHQDNYKSLLLEFAQARGWSQPLYRISAEEGPGHEKIFTVEVLINEEVMGTGTARSRKKAEQQAASVALGRLADADDPQDREI